MQHVAVALRSFAEEFFKAALHSDPSSAVRPILVGPPPGALQAFFDLVTSNGTRIWTVPIAGSPRQIAVLLVRSSSTSTSGGTSTIPLSQACHWDYAVTLRNSTPLVLMLVEHGAWDTRHDSLQNTTETVGPLSLDREGRWLRDPLWRYMVRLISTSIGLDAATVTDALKPVTQHSDVDPETGRLIPWNVANALLAPSPAGLSSLDVLFLGTGLPSSGGATVTVDAAAEVLRRLGEFLGSEGIHEGIAALKATTTATTLTSAPHLDAFEQHLNGLVLSGANFARAPAWYMRPDGLPPIWWTELTVEHLDQLLNDVDSAPPPGERIHLVCTNAVNTVRRAPGEPCIVRGRVDLMATVAGGTPITSPAFSRRQPRAAGTPLPSTAGNPCTCTDISPPAHNKPYKYEVEAAGFRPGTVDVLDVESFGCRGFVRVPDAERNRPPVCKSGQSRWIQEIVLPRSGTTDFIVYHPATAAQLRVSRMGTPPATYATGGRPSTSLVLDIDDNEELEFSLVDPSNTNIGDWTVHCTVDEPGEVQTSRFEVLVSAHQNDRSPGAPEPAAMPIQQLENAYLASADSWKPVVLCASTRTFPLHPDWTDTHPKIGDLSPSTDPRPTVSPPAFFVDARNAIREAVLPHECSISQLDLSDATLAFLIEHYLFVYIQWFLSNPDEAVWSDCIAVYDAEWREEASTHIASTEPVAMLLSPLHPLRLGWHVLAQTQLVHSLAPAERCPAAGLLDPSACPDVGHWQLQQTGSSSMRRTFFAVECDNVHWPILLSRTYVDRDEIWNRVRHVLAMLGLEVKGITGGITRPQAADSLHQITSLEPARAVLRVGIVGASEGSQSSTDGIMRWCEDRFADDGSAIVGPAAVEVYDLREANHPTPESLAHLSEKTHENVRWFRVTNSVAMPHLDLSILDQLGTRSPAAESGATRSAVGYGALCRVRIREDFQQAQWLRESRIGSSGISGTGLAATLREAISLFEGRAANDGASHVRFQPLQQAIGARLQKSIFVAISSSQLDPACMVRGAMGQGGYLWNFELPGALGGPENRVGYYLVANPVDAMREALTRSCELLTATPPSPQDLLEEISRRGIPIMKRLVSGGAASRGELGMLLAVRLLQDVFRGGAPLVQLPVRLGECVHVIIPVDPYMRVFDRIRSKLCRAGISAQRGDFIVVSIRLPAAASPVELKLTPVEVKFRDTVMNEISLRAALNQAANLGEVMNAMWAAAGTTDLWRTCRQALLAQCLDFAFRIYSHEDVHGATPAEWANIHQRVLQDVIDGCAQVTVMSDGRLLVFDRSITTATVDIDGNGRPDTAVLCPSDAEALLLGGRLSARAQTVARVLDFSFPTCGTAATSPSPSPATAPVVIFPPDASQSIPNAQTGSPSPADVSNAATAHASGDESSVANASATDDAESEAGNGDDTTEETHAPVFTSPIPAGLRQRVRDAFQGFIGNEPAVRRLSNDLLRALIELPPHLSKNYLITGQPSTGKTELARRIAVALALPFVKLDGRGVQNRERLFDLINGEVNQQQLAPSHVGQVAGLPVHQYPPLIVFIDEVHLVPRGVQESLLTMLEAADRTVTLSNQVARMSTTTFIFATTRASDIDTAFRTRCTEIQLREYTQEEVAEIVRRKFELRWPTDVYIEIAKLGRCVPRIAIELARELETAITVSEHVRTPREHLDEVREARELDELGLNRVDLHYLELLERENRQIGEQPLLNMLGTVDRDRILDEVEPFLKRLGFIRLGPRGREITPDGRAYVLRRRRHS